MLKRMGFMGGMILTLVLAVLFLGAGVASADLLEDLARQVQQPGLLNMDVSLEKETITLRMHFSKEMEYHYFSLEHPTRFVIDIPNGWEGLTYDKLNFQDRLLKEIRLGVHEDKLRIVVELNYPGPEASLRWDEEKQVLTMQIQRRFLTQTVEEIAPDVKLYRMTRGIGAGPVSIKVVEIDAFRYPEGRKMLKEIGSSNLGPEMVLRPAFQKSGVRGFINIQDLALQEEALVAINGGYYGPDGFPLGLLIQDGQIVSPSINNRTTWIMDQDGKMYIEQMDLRPELVVDYLFRYSLSGINRPRYDNELVLYTPIFGRSTKTNQWGYEIIIQNGRIIGVNPEGNSRIPEEGMVISGHGDYKKMLQELEVGSRVEVELNLRPNRLEDKILHAIGGGPKLVENGMIRITGTEEKFQPDILMGRSPRSALGITPDNKLLMVTVDGRSKESQGYTLYELAEEMISLGATQAMNLDGGGSSTLVIDGEVINIPSNGLRVVHNGLVLKWQE